jgi:hypothetical protein
MRQLAIDDVQVGSANAASADADQQLARDWLGRRQFGLAQRRAGFVQHHGKHDAVSDTETLTAGESAIERL